MNYESWVESVPTEIKDEPLWRMEVYRLALFSGDLAWHAVTRLIHDKRTISLADQLNRAVGSVGANISEGYSRQSGRDQARFYEYALGSARETRNWYYQGRHVLGENVARHRIQLLTQIIGLLLTIIPSQRNIRIEEESPGYSTISSKILTNMPMDL